MTDIATDPARLLDNAGNPGANGAGEHLADPRPEANEALAALASRSSSQPPPSDDGYPCRVPGCTAGEGGGVFVSRTPQGRAGHERSHGSVDTGESSSGRGGGGGAPNPPLSPATMDEARAWIDAHLQPGILTLASMTGVPREALAGTKRDPETGFDRWPGDPSPFGRLMQLDDLAVNVYAGCWVYGRDTWLYEMLERNVKKGLPVALVLGAAFVTIQQVAKMAAVRNLILEHMKAAAEAQARAAAQQQQQRQSGAA